MSNNYAYNNYFLICLYHGNFSSCICEGCLCQICDLISYVVFNRILIEFQCNKNVSWCHVLDFSVNPDLHFLRCTVRYITPTKICLQHLAVVIARIVRLSVLTRFEEDSLPETTFDQKESACSNQASFGV